MKYYTVFIILIMYNFTYGCSCIPVKYPLCENYNIIFIGKLLKKEKLPSYRLAVKGDSRVTFGYSAEKLTFLVISPIKNIFQDTVEVFQDLNNCTFEFKKGKSLVVGNICEPCTFSHKMIKGKIRTSKCFPNRNLNASSKD